VAAVSREELRLRERARGGDDFLRRASRDHAAIGNSLVFPFLLGEPEAADVLDPVERDAERDGEASLVRIDGRDLALDRISRWRHGWALVRWRNSRTAAKNAA